MTNPKRKNAPLLDPPAAGAGDLPPRKGPLSDPMRPLLGAGLLMLVAWAGVYLLLFSHTLWHGPSLVPDHWPQIFYPFESRLPYDWVHAHRDTLAGFWNVVAWLVLVAILFAAWFWALRGARRVPPGDRTYAREGLLVVLSGLLFSSLLLIFSPGFTSQDLYSYIWYGKMAGVYGISPFTHAPSLFTEQDYRHWLQWVYWKDQPAVYGPAWVWPAAWLAQLAEARGGDIVLYLLGHRIFAAGLHLANTLLVWVLAGKLTRYRTDLRLGAAIFYGWCPLTVWEFANNGHNDALMIFWVLVAAWCHLQGMAWAARRGRTLAGWWQAALAALTLAGLVKAVGFVLIPAYIMLLFAAAGGAHAWRRRAAITLQAAAVMVTLGALLYLPYWEGPTTLKVILTAPGNDRYVNSLGEIIRFRGADLIHNLGMFLGLRPPTWTLNHIDEAVERWVRPIMTASAGAIMLVLSLRVRNVRGLLRAWAWLLVAYVLVGALWFWPWYITWFMPFAALLGGGRIRTTAILYAIGGMVLYGLAPIIPPPLAALQDWVPLVCFGPVALYLGLATTRDGQQWWRRTGSAGLLEALRRALMPPPFPATGPVQGPGRV